MCLCLLGMCFIGLKNMLWVCVSVLCLDWNNGVS